MKSRMVRKGIVAAKKTKKKIINFVKANPKKTAVGVGGVASVGYVKSGLAARDQNIKIEMQKISKERRAGKKFTRKELTNRLNKAKKSKREFTWI
tara:strand:- start:762 stop:1046 length:285 start_codon:yes stop_codon:yes gene_type:complete